MAWFSEWGSTIKSPRIGAVGTRPDMTFDVGKDGQLPTTNHPLESILGWPPSSSTGAVKVIKMNAPIIRKQNNIDK